MSFQSITSDISGFTGDVAARRNLKMLIKSLSRLLWLCWSQAFASLSLELLTTGMLEGLEHGKQYTDSILRTSISNLSCEEMHQMLQFVAEEWSFHVVSSIITKWDEFKKQEWTDCFWVLILFCISNILDVFMKRRWSSCCRSLFPYWNEHSFTLHPSAVGFSRCGINIISVIWVWIVKFIPAQTVIIFLLLFMVTGSSTSAVPKLRKSCWNW